MSEPRTARFKPAFPGANEMLAEAESLLHSLARDAEVEHTPDDDQHIARAHETIQAQRAALGVPEKPPATGNPQQQPRQSDDGPASTIRRVRADLAASRTEWRAAAAERAAERARARAEAAAERRAFVDALRADSTGAPIRNEPAPSDARTPLPSKADDSLDLSAFAEPIVVEPEPSPGPASPVEQPAVRALEMPKLEPAQTDTVQPDPVQTEPAPAAPEPTTTPGLPEVQDDAAPESETAADRATAENTAPAPTSIFDHPPVTYVPPCPPIVSANDSAPGEEPPIAPAPDASDQAPSDTPPRFQAIEETGPSASDRTAPPPAPPASASPFSAVRSEPGMTPQSLDFNALIQRPDRP